MLKKLIGSAATLAALAAPALATPTLAALATPALAQADPSPWTQADYHPTPGNWQPYVLAPHGHSIAPQSVLFGDPRSGQIIGDQDAALGHGGSVRLVSHGNRSGSPLLVIDFGHEVAGQVRVNVTGASPNPPGLHACFSESRQFMALSPGQNNGETAIAPGCDTANIWNGYPGFAYTWDSDSHLLPLAGKTFPATVTDPTIRGGFRYLTLFLDGPGSVSLNGVSLQFTSSPLEPDPAAYKGWFLSSDNALNKVWYAGAYTVQIDTTMSGTAKSWPYSTGEADQANSQIPGADPNGEVILDGGKRDRDTWQGDLAVEGPVSFLSTGDTGAVENTLNGLASQQMTDGFVPAEGLVGPHNTGEQTTYGEYVTWFINNMYQHWLYTGDKAYVDKWWTALLRTHAWLDSVRLHDPTGLISFQGDEPQTAGSCGHYAYSDCGHETYVNALYYRNLLQMAELATVEGYPQLSPVFTQEAADLKNRINLLLWDGSSGAYELSLEDTTDHPQDSQVAPVITGVASAAQASSALHYLKAHNWNTYGSLMVGAPSSVQPMEYEPLPMGFEAQARLGSPDATQAEADNGQQLIRNYWGWQLTQDPGGTFWEKANASGVPSIGQFTSLAHGWAAGPTISLTTQVLGVNPTGAGFSTFDVVPHPGSLAWSQGVVPTPAGPISASWHHEDGTFKLGFDQPKTTTARAGVPTFNAPVSVTVDGRPVWDGGKALDPSASSDGAYVYVTGLTAGHHEIVATTIARAPEHVAYDFEDGTPQGFSAGTATASVSAVSSFADHPGTPFAGSYALDAACQGVPPTVWHTVSVVPVKPLDLTRASTFVVHEDSFGGVNASAYQTQVTLTSANPGATPPTSETLTLQADTPSDQWNTVKVPISTWAGRGAVKQIDIAWRANGATQPAAWGCHFQLDDIGWR